MQIMQEILINEDIRRIIFTVAKSVVSWKAELQDTITLSTTEAEYMATVKSYKKAL